MNDIELKNFNSEYVCRKMPKQLMGGKFRPKGFACAIDFLSKKKNKIIDQISNKININYHDIIAFGDYSMFSLANHNDTQILYEKAVENMYKRKEEVVQEIEKSLGFSIKDVDCSNERFAGLSLNQIIALYVNDEHEEYIETINNYKKDKYLENMIYSETGHDICYFDKAGFDTQTWIYLNREENKESEEEIKNIISNIKTYAQVQEVVTKLLSHPVNDFKNFINIFNEDSNYEEELVKLYRTDSNGFEEWVLQARGIERQAEYFVLDVKDRYGVNLNKLMIFCKNIIYYENRPYKCFDLLLLSEGDEGQRKLLEEILLYIKQKEKKLLEKMYSCGLTDNGFKTLKKIEDDQKIDQLSCYCKFSINLYKKLKDKGYEEFKDLFENKTTIDFIDSLDLSFDADYELRKAGFNTILDIIEKSPTEIYNSTKLRIKSVNEIYEKVCNAKKYVFDKKGIVKKIGVEACEEMIDKFKEVGILFYE